MGKMAHVEPNSGLMLPIVARFATGTAATPSPWNSTNLPTTPWARRISGIVSTRAVGGGPPGGPPGEPEPDHPRDQHRHRLAEHGRLGLDAADPPAEDAEPVLHGGMGVGADAGVRVSGNGAVVRGLHHDHPGQVLDVDLVH